jgi:hypothetical protein
MFRYIDDPRVVLGIHASLQNLNYNGLIFTLKNDFIEVEV